MAISGIDLDRLAVFLKNQLEERNLSVRRAAAEIGCSPATLGRLLQGAASPNTPDSANLLRAVSWLGRNLADFAPPAERPRVGIADVEVHLRALPGLQPADAEALVAMVRAAYNARLGTKKTARR
jgi:transcriptional regulator with XRE-family HTH domain